MINKIDHQGLVDLFLDGLEFCRASNISRVLVTFLDTPSTELVDKCRSTPLVCGLVFPDVSNTKIEDPKREGRLLPAEFTWQLPTAKAEAIIYLGPGNDLNFRMALRARANGVKWFVFPGAVGWRKLELSNFLIRRFLERFKITVSTRSLGGRQTIRKISRKMGRSMWLLYVKRVRTKEDGTGIAQLERPVRKLIDHFERMSERQYQKALTCEAVPLLAKEDFATDRILLTNASLAWGGAERQIANTLVGLKSRGYDNLLLLCEHLKDRPEHDFYLHYLEQAGVEAREREHHFPPINDIDTNILESLNETLEYLPSYLRDDIFSFALEFLRYRPAVFHAWQDSTSIKAGFAAVLVGVPRVILNGRNMAPYNFAYFLPYMRSIYSVLSRFESVVFLNNSTAGAADYEQWIGLERGRVKVLHNGLKDDDFQCKTNEHRVNYRRTIGIPDDAKVVGSIYRLSEEKGPFLWIDTAAKIANEVDDVYFLILGKGPLREQMLERAKDVGIADRLFMPGTEKLPALAFSAMDVFMMTSRLEGTPNVCIEAQWMGLPVVAPNVGGTADTILDGKTGWVVASRNKHLLSEKVVRTLTDDLWRENAIKLAPEFARKRFGFERMIDDTIDVYGLSK